MFDLHCHILPGVDDGATDWEESLEMAGIFVENGVKTIVATPHSYADILPEQIQMLTVELNNRLAERDLPLTVVPGMEVHLDIDLPEQLRAGKILPIAERNVLLELPSNLLPLYTDDVVFRLMLEGYRVILAHPERNSQVIKNPELIFDWVSKGVLVQITSGSVLGKFGEQIQRTTKQLLKANLVHFIGSDAHGTTRRKPDLAEAATALRNLAVNAREIYEVNGHLLLLDKFQPQDNYTSPVTVREPWWKRLRGNRR